MIDNDKKTIVIEVRLNRAKREEKYRAKALKMFPWICGKCSREFKGKRLSELTVHHKDHDHNNNPVDGSNWELLCIYCHENEHSRYKVAESYTEESLSMNEEDNSFKHNPFAKLKDMLKNC